MPPPPDAGDLDLTADELDDLLARGVPVVGCGHVAVSGDLAGAQLWCDCPPQPIVGNVPVSPAYL